MRALKTQTKYFGEIAYEPSERIAFPRGLFGFEDERDFLLLTFPGDGKLYSLQSLTTPRLAFVAVDPFTLCVDYEPQLQPQELEELGVKESTDLFYYALCAVKTPVGDSTVNLRCPIAINGDTRQAMQVILEEKRYGMRHLLSNMERQEGKPC